MDVTLLLAQALAVLAFVALLLALVVFVRRAARFLAESRDAERFRRSLADITGRAVASLDDVMPQIDGVRRRTIAADAIVERLNRTSDAIVAYSDEARTLRGPEPASLIRDGLITELERAGRALEMVEHGCAILSVVHGEPRAPEAQTSIKRGYLNILHAREAIVVQAARANEVAVPEPWRLFQPPSA